MKEILIKLRQENRYSQSLLSRVLGISRQAYMKYESGEVEPSVEIVRKLSKIYKVPYDVLIDNKVQKEPKKVLYGFPEEKSLNVASPSACFEPSNSYNCGTNFVDGGVDSVVQYFQNQLNNLQEVIMEMRNKLSALTVENTKDSFSENSKSYSKSKSFNKDEFFKKVGKLNIDSTFVNELRETSLI